MVFSGPQGMPALEEVLEPFGGRARAERGVEDRFELGVVGGARGAGVEARVVHELGEAEDAAEHLPLVLFAEGESDDDVAIARSGRPGTAWRSGGACRWSRAPCR